MRLTSNIDFTNFKINGNKKKILNLLFKILKKKNQIIDSFKKNYKYPLKKLNIYNFKKYSKVNLIGMGGSSLGAKAIYNFLKHKISRKFFFIDNLETENKSNSKGHLINLIISKSGNTLETIANSNILIKKHHKNIFITENKNSYLRNLAEKLKAEIFDHNNYIGGRYSVLSEVGMIPAQLMGLKSLKFKQYDKLIKNKFFLDSLVMNVSNILTLIKKKKYNSVILNYDKKSNDLFFWYQQLIAESLGKNNNGIFPIISNLPKDNHSLMQYYLDGPKINFYTFFYVNDETSLRIKNKDLLKSHSFLKNKTINDIKFSQYIATQNVFERKKIPFRSFFINKRNEEAMGELFTFFILETILLGKAMKLNAFDQPAVELIKIDTKKKLI